MDYVVHVNERIGTVVAINELSATAPANGDELILFSDKDEDKNAQKVKVFFNAKLKDIKIIVTGNAKVWDVGIAEIKHWWE